MVSIDEVPYLADGRSTQAFKVAPSVRGGSPAVDPPADPEEFGGALSKAEGVPGFEGPVSDAEPDVVVMPDEPQQKVRRSRTRPKAKAKVKATAKGGARPGSPRAISGVGSDADEPPLLVVDESFEDDKTKKKDVRAEAQTVRHKLTHEPFNPYFRACV